MKVVFLMGLPGTGKTSLFRQFMKESGDWGTSNKDEGFGLVPYHKNGTSLIIGKYDNDEVFAGTDKLSMAVQPEAIKFLEALKKNGKINTVFLEGDRLSTGSFVEDCYDKYDIAIYYLKVSKEELARRYAERGSDQSETFIKGRQTKYSNILSNFNYMDLIKECYNETQEDQKKIVTELLNEM